MTARGKLVGVIDLQSTRVNAYTEYDRALLRLIAARVAIAIDNARLYRRVERQNRTLKTLAQHLARVLVHPGSERTAEQDRQHHARADQLRRLQHPLRGPRSQGAAPPVQHPLRPAREYRQRSAGQGHHRRRRGIARRGARARYRQGPALHRLASRYPLGSGRAADGAGPRGRRDGPGKRPRRLLHRRSRAHAGAAGAAGGQQRGKRAPVPGDGRARAAHGRGPAGRARAAARAAAGRATRRSKAWTPPCACAPRAKSRATSTKSSSIATGRP